MRRFFQFNIRMHRDIFLWFDPLGLICISSFLGFFFTHFDFVRMYDFRGNHVTPYMPSISRQLCIMIFKNFYKLTDTGK